MTTFQIDTAVDDLARPGAHVLRTAGTGVRVCFPNGWVVSIQWSAAHYCENRRHARNGPLAPLLPARDSATAEVAAWHSASGCDGWPDGDLVRWPNGETVVGYRTWQDVQSILDLAERGAL